MKNSARIVAIGCGSTAVAAVAAWISHSRTWVEAASTGTAYAAMLLLAVTLALGPIRILRTTHNPVHSVTRRDFGIAAGIAAIVHTALGLQVHMDGELIRYFTMPGAGGVTGTLFVSANYLGLAGALILAGLILISNNIAIRRLGLESWKRIQRYAYAAAILSAIHGILYQVLEKRIALLLILVLTSTVLLALQLRASRARSHRDRRSLEPTTK